jgi:hypothetical protein
MNQTGQNGQKGCANSHYQPIVLHPHPKTSPKTHRSDMPYFTWIVITESGCRQ